MGKTIYKKPHEKLSNRVNIDENVLLMCTKRKANVDVTIYTVKIQKQLKLDLSKLLVLTQ